MAKKDSNFVPQSEASKKASNAAYKRFALGALTDLYKEQQEKAAAAASTSKPKKGKK